MGLRLRKKKDAMEFGQKNSGDRDALELAYLENADQWMDLLKKIKATFYFDHLTTLLAAVKDPKDDRYKERLKNAGKQAKNFKDKLKERSTSIDIQGSTQEYEDEVYQYIVPKYERKLLQLEAVYRDLLSEEFCYHVGTLGPAMDLFFLNVLLNRGAMADVFWKRCAQVLAINDSNVKVIFF